MQMRLAKRQVTDTGEIRTIVKECRTVRLGLADEEGMFIVPMSFGYEWADPGSRLVLWLHSARDGRKARALAAAGDAGAPVALEMDVEDGVIRGDFSCAYSFAYRSIMGWGVARSVQGPELKRHGLGRIMAHLAPGEPAVFSPEAIERTDVWRVEVTELTAKRRAPKVSA